ncbi:MAG: UDP-glucose 4-epimerase [Firmicutes bacterium ADurb.Bin373]|nr:MAG: UDP-glucose 4-epimerase [Firmicutes bacterium ADurb.Bin373]
MIDADITSLNWIEVLSSGDYDAIFHYAGSANIQESVSNPSYDFHANLLATFSLLDAMRTIRWEGRFIFSSSAAVYGNPARLPVCESDPVFPISPYGVSKLAAERYIAVYCRLYNLQAASLRSASVYGPRLRKQVVYDTFKKIINNPAEILIYGDGSQTRDFVYVKDAVQAALVVAEKGALRGETYNLASGKATSILELTRKIADELDASPVFNFSGDLRAGEPDKWVFDQSRLAEIGFKPKYSLSEGIRETSKWIKKIDR